MEAERQEGSPKRKELLADQLPIVTTKIGDKWFVAGLLWEIMPRTQHYAKDAQKKGTDYGADIVAFRHGVGEARQVQAGFAPKAKRESDGSSRAGKKGAALGSGHGPYKGMYSWAAAVVGHVGDDCLVGLKISDNLYGIAAQLNGFIVPGADRIVARDEFEKVWNSIYNRSQASKEKFARIIAPAEFGLAKDELLLGDVINAKTLQRKYILKPLKKFDFTKQELKKFAATVGGFGLIVVGGYFVYRHIAAANALKQEIAYNLEAAKNQLLAKQRHEAFEKNNIVPHPWPLELSPAAALAACTAGLEHVYLSVGGWPIKSATCSTDDATPGVAHIDFLYARPPKGTTFLDFQTMARAYFGIEPSQPDTNYESAHIQLARKVVASGNEVVMPDAQATAELVAHFQAKNIQITLKPIPAKAQPDPKDPKNQDPPRQDFKQYTFSVTTSETPASALNGIEETGIRIDNLSAAIDYKSGVRTWTIGGSLYVR